VRAFTSPEVKERVVNAGSEVVAGSPDQFGAAVKSEMMRLGKVIKDANIRAQ
jgi:tripartite-type tricarboxylate transporter receptor subunit TctC